MYVLELGGQDDAFAAAEAASAVAGVERLAPGLATAREITDRVQWLAFTHRASDVVTRCPPDVERARDVLADATLDRSGTVAVRAEDVRGRTGVDTQRVERVLGQVLVDRGFTVDLEQPDHELRALFARETCVLGWLAIESVRDFGERRPTDRPFFQPGSMDPLLARALVNLAGARPETTLLDPMCGTGGILIEAGLVGARTLGIDAQAKMVAGARANLEAALDDSWDVARGDARSLPVVDDGVDAVVFDAPYGRQSKIEGDRDDLVRAALVESRRVAPRAVIVADRPLKGLATDAGWTVEATFARRVHRSLTRHILVLRD